MKCNNCYLRYHCDEQTEYICKHNNYCKYMPEQEVQEEHTCEYCKPPFKHCGKYYISTGYDNDPYLYTIRKEDSFGGAMIKYCPWCGRELDPWY